MLISENIIKEGSMDKIELCKTVRAIAFELTLIEQTRGLWTLDEELLAKYSDASYVAIRNAINPAESISICLHESSKKYNISAVWPTGRNNQLLYPRKPHEFKGNWFSFNCSSAKSASVIAKSIHRQLLLEYRTQLAELLQEESEQENRESNRENIAEGIAKTMGIPYPKDRKSNKYPEVFLPYDSVKGLPRVEVVIASETDIKFTIESGSMILTGALLLVLKQWIDEHTKEKPKTDPVDIFMRLLEKKVPADTLAEFVVINWDEEHMGALPTGDEEAVNKFMEYYDIKKGEIDGEVSHDQL
jgi:hypothetical protein